MKTSESDCLHHIPFKKTGFFSKTITDYLNQDKKIQSFYGNFSTLKGFKKQIELKKKSVKEQSRTSLVKVLNKQYCHIKKVALPNKVRKNIHLLEKENTFTITTGHQLNLFTGPLYFLYKIISTINLCEQLSAKFPENNFVPIYWMATEDHDFEEINFFNFNQKKIKWSSYQTGAVGRFSTQGLEDVFNVFSSELNASKNANELREIFKNGYLNNNNLADATRYIANELFGEYGLVILDADDVDLKREFIPYVKKELLEQTSFIEVSKTIIQLEKEYKIQVNPREINLFYLANGLRERVILENGIYKINNTNIVFLRDEILEELQNYPDKFSPNVIMRPLYQEVILPNLCYIGGGGELAYWLELKKYFEAVEVVFPILLLRNSVQIISKKQAEKLNKLTISVEELFFNQNDLLHKKVTENSTINVNFSSQKEFLQQQFSKLKKIAQQTDKSFIGAVKAQEKKQLKGLVNLEKRWLRAEKRNQQELVKRIVNLQDELLPNQSLEERQRNFSEFYQEYGREFISVLKDNLDPLKLEFTVLKM